MSSYPVRYDESPEVAPQHVLPEVYIPQENTIGHERTHSQHQQQPAQQEWSPLHSHPSAIPLASPVASYQKQDESIYDRSALDTTAASTLHHYSEEPRAPEPPYSGKKRAGFLCGCSGLVLVLSIIIALLSVAVLGLAAGTGVAASKYNDANTKLAALSSSYSSLANSPQTSASSTSTSTTSTAAPTATSFSKITNGCSDQDESTSGQIYVPKFFDKPTFTMFCNSDTPPAPIFSLFTADFNTCMDACASWNWRKVGEDDKACKGVSFIPAWGNITIAVLGGAPGDCYLKPGPLNRTTLTTPNIGQECHAGILEDSKNDSDNKSSS